MVEQDGGAGVGERHFVDTAVKLYGEQGGGAGGDPVVAGHWRAHQHSGSAAVDFDCSERGRLSPVAIAY